MRVKSTLVLFPILCLILLLAPILLGLVSTWLPAFGYMPVIGATHFSLSYFNALFQHPAFTASVTSTLVSGIGATVLSLALAFWVIMHLYGTRSWAFLQKSLSPLLAMPHAAFAIGIALLISPSGWLLRIISPDITGFDSPPDWLILKDPKGYSLLFVLVLKETPFLILMILSALNQIKFRETFWVGSSLGYSSIRIWSRLVIPQLMPKLRLPILAVAAYSLSVVDISLIVGPSAPPTFAVLINRWFNDPDVSMRLLGSAGAVVLFLIVALVLLSILIIEQLLAKTTASNLVNGSRRSIISTLRPLAYGLNYSLSIIGIVCLAVLIIWSFTQVWRFPDALPSAYSLKYWAKSWPNLVDLSITSVTIALASTLISAIIVVGCLEFEVWAKRNGQSINHQRVLLLNYLPLLIPQIAFIFGVQVLLLWAHVEGTWFSMVWSHLIFVLPYVFLTLSGVYRGYDQRFYDVALTLSGSKWKSFYQIKLPMLLKPLLYSTAIGCSVSLAQYLPTLFAGAGRFSTVTTETVNLASGSDRRVMAVYALWQFAIPLIIFALAIGLPNRIFKDRVAMKS